MTLPNKYNVLTKDGVWKWLCFSPVRLSDEVCIPPNNGKGEKFDFFKINLRSIDSSIYTKKEVELMATRTSQDAVSFQTYTFNNLLNMNTAGAGNSPPHSNSAENTLYNIIKNSDPRNHINLGILIYLNLFIENIQYFLAFAYIINVLHGLTRVYKLAKNGGKFILVLISIIKALVLIHIDIPQPPPPMQGRKMEPLILKEFYGQY